MSSQCILSLIAAIENQDKKTFLELTAPWKEIPLEHDDFGLGPIHYAAELGLIDFLSELLKKGIPVDFCGVGESEGVTALHLASKGGHRECINLLLENKANIWAKDQNELLPIHYAREHPDCLDLLVKTEPRTLDAVDKYGWTPLHFAASSNLLPSVELLLNLKCDVSSRDKSGRTAWDVASQKGHLQVLKLLKPK